MGNASRVVSYGNGSNYQIVGTNWRTLSSKPGADATIHFSRFIIERQATKLAKESC